MTTIKLQVFCSYFFIIIDYSIRFREVFFLECKFKNISTAFSQSIFWAQRICINASAPRLLAVIDTRSHVRSLRINFSKAAISRSKDYYFAIKEMFAILALFFLPNNVAVFPACKQGVEASTLSSCIRFN